MPLLKKHINPSLHDASVLTDDVPECPGPQLNHLILVEAASLVHVAQEEPVSKLEILELERLDAVEGVASEAASNRGFGQTSGENVDGVWTSIEFA